MHLLDLPDDALAAVVDAVLLEDRGALRAACRRARRATNTRTSKLCWTFLGGECAEELALIQRQFPFLSTLCIEMNAVRMLSAHRALVAGLAALPNCCWPSIACAGAGRGEPFPLAAAAKLVRLCPRLERAAFQVPESPVSWGPARGAAAASSAGLCSLAAAAQTLRELRLEVRCPLREKEGSEAAGRTAPALAQLGALRRLEVTWCTYWREGAAPPPSAPGGPASLLPTAALRGLTALMTLVVESDYEWQRPLQLDACPESLRELHLQSEDGTWPVDSLRTAARPLPGVTLLSLVTHGGPHEVPSALDVIAATCPALQELRVDGFGLLAPAAALQRLTSLDIAACNLVGGVDPAAFAAAFPRLASLRRHNAWRCGGWGDAIASHPKLLALDLDLRNDTEFNDQPEEEVNEWTYAAGTLPALSRLAPSVDQGPFWQAAGEPGGGAALLLRILDPLRWAERLTRLDLTANMIAALSAPDTLAAVGLVTHGPWEPGCGR